MSLSSDFETFFEVFFQNIISIDMNKDTKNIQLFYFLEILGIKTLFLLTTTFAPYFVISSCFFLRAASNAIKSEETVPWSALSTP